MSQTEIHVAIAILTREDKFLCQLRDDIPNIRYPGYWGLFGGHLEAGETPEIALVRELKEEINYTVNHDFRLFGYYPEPGLMRHIFHVPLTVDLEDLTLLEGWDLGFLTTDDIIAGKCYSPKANMTRSLALPHQRILLDFLGNGE